ncbi:MAG: type VI secretion system contractile sheath large subunit [Verrucomicrobia bacterium]|nr:type VI secretion system contractile sheath large subunit [Verrucomicrobiota bacterium]
MTTQNSSTASNREGATQTAGENDLDRLLGQTFRTQQDVIQREVQTFVDLAAANENIISDSALDTIDAIKAEIDRRLSEQINAILHNDEFRQLEGTWRGLHYLVCNTATDERLKIRVLNISKKELGRVFRSYKGAAWDQSPLFKKIYEEEFGTPGGEPYGAIIGDYGFDHSAPDVEILSRMAQIVAAAHCPFIAGAAPEVMGFGSWQELANPRDLTKVFTTPEHASWRSLRKQEDSKYIGLAMPRFLSRMPYGPTTNAVEEFNFIEDTGTAGEHGLYVWSNAAYAMGVNITRSFKEYGWCSRIRGVESGGVVSGLPVHTFPTDDGGVDMKCPTEIAITDRREAELAKNGFMPLSHWKNTDYSVFIGAQSLHQPDEYDDPDATANARLGARLPYMFATCRFAHFLKCLVRDKIGSFKERADMESFLNDWIKNYTTATPSATDREKAERPLAEALVEVTEVEGNPGYYSAKFYLRPHYQLEGLTASLRLVSKLPAPTAG